MKHFIILYFLLLGFYSQAETQTAIQTATQTKPQAKTQAVTQTKPQAKTQAVTQTKPQAKTQAVTQTKPQAKTQAVTQTKPQAKTQVVTQTKPQAKTQVVTQTKPQAKTQAVTQTKPQAKTQAVTQTKPQAKTQAVTQTKPQAKIQAVTQTKPQAKIQAVTQTKPQAKTQAEIQAEIQTVTQTEIQAEIQTVTQTEIQAKTQAKTQPEIQVAIQTKPQAEVLSEVTSPSGASFVQPVNTNLEEASNTSSQWDPNLQKAPLSEDRPFLLDATTLELGLEYPINFGLQLKYRFDDFSYVRFGLGFMSGLFLQSFEKLSSSFGYLEDHESKLLSDTFKNSMYLDLRLGWIPYFKRMGGGPYMELGISNAFLGKGELESGDLSRSTPNYDEGYDETKTYFTKTTTLNGTFHVGYSIPFENIKFNFEVGVVKVFHAMFMDLEEDQIPPGLKSFSEIEETHFKSFLENRGWIFPTFSGWISFSF